MSMRALVLVLVLAASPAAAHDFWIQPESFQLQVGVATPITLQVGHGDERQRSQLPMRRIRRFLAVGPEGKSYDLRGALDLGGPNADGALMLDAPGGHVLVLETDSRARNNLPADRFRAYVEEEGLTPALGTRSGAAVSERYSRNAKALVRVGDAGAQTQITRPVGLPLEIVPDVAPAGGTTLPVRVFYQDQPLAGALVKLTNLDQDAKPLEMRRTDGAGLASFAVPDRGRWILNVVWTRPLAASEDAEFETVFSSLSFATP